jgi:hypothetical protein
MDCEMCHWEPCGCDVSSLRDDLDKLTIQVKELFLLLEVDKKLPKEEN